MLALRIAERRGVKTGDAKTSFGTVFGELATRCHLQISNTEASDHLSRPLWDGDVEEAIRDIVPHVFIVRNHDHRRTSSLGF